MHALPLYLPPFLLPSFTCAAFTDLQIHTTNPWNFYFHCAESQEPGEVKKKPSPNPTYDLQKTNMNYPIYRNTKTIFLSVSGLMGIRLYQWLPSTQPVSFIFIFLSFNCLWWY